jgi:hypothetical protein
MIRGLVAEQLSLAPAQGAVVMLLRVESGGDLQSVGMATTDAAGAFTLTAPEPGRYRVQADLGGLSTPLSQTFDLTLEGPVGDVALLLPSPLLRLGLTCQVEAGEGTAALVGVVRDSDTAVPLPDAHVTATWREGRMVYRAEGTSDGAGRYRLCGFPPNAGTVGVDVQLLGRSTSTDDIEIRSPAVVVHDVDVSMTTQAAAPRDVIQERILKDAAARSLGDVHGQVRDQITGRPVPYAVVRVGSTPHQTPTDEEGRFVFESLTPGTYTLEIRNLGYSVRSDPVEVPPGKDVYLDLRVAAQAVELEGLEVTTRSTVEENIRLTPFRRDIAFGDAMAVEEQRGALAFEILRRTSPGLRVTEIPREDGPPTVCIQTNRRIQSLTEVRRNSDRIDLIDSSLSSVRCANVQVVVDGIKIPDGPEYLLRTPASEIESMEFVSPVQAQILYGAGGTTSNGVVVVYTRGRGPYASPLRNRRN